MFQPANSYTDAMALWLFGFGMMMLPVAVGFALAAKTLTVLR